MLRRSTSALLLYLGALALLSSGSYAQNGLDTKMFTLAGDENSLLGLDDLVDKFDSGPSSGPFSNKPGWPNLNPPVNDTLAPAPVPASAPGVVQQTVIGSAGTTAVSPMSTPTPAPAPALTPSMAPSPASQQNSSPSPNPASTTPVPDSKHVVMPIHEPTKTTEQGGDLLDRSQCSKDSILVSVEGKGSYCVSATKPICSGLKSKGKCPGKQSGLEQGSYCGLVKSGVFGCLPGAGPVRCDGEED